MISLRPMHRTYWINIYRCKYIGSPPVRQLMICLELGRTKSCRVPFWNFQSLRSCQDFSFSESRSFFFFLYWKTSSFSFYYVSSITGPRRQNKIKTKFLTNTFIGYAFQRQRRHHQLSMSYNNHNNNCIIVTIRNEGAGITADCLWRSTNYKGHGVDIPWHNPHRQHGKGLSPLKKWG